MPSNSRLKKAARQLAKSEGIAYVAARRRLQGDEAAPQSSDAAQFGTVQAKRLADPHVLAAQRRALYQSHVAPLNEFVDSLAENSGQFVPHLAPTYGGVNARILTIFEKPSPKTLPGTGTGMLSVENPDEAARRFLEVFQAAGLDVKDLVSWNAFPWHIDPNATGSRPSRGEGIQTLVRLFELLPSLEVVVAHGNPAKEAWKTLRRRYPEIADRYKPFGTISTGWRALSAKPAERARREAELAETYVQVAALLRS